MFYYDSSDEEDNYGSGSTPNKDLENKLMGIMNSNQSQEPKMGNNNNFVSTAAAEQKRQKMMQALNAQSQRNSTGDMNGMVTMSRPFSTQSHLRGFSRGMTPQSPSNNMPQWNIETQQKDDVDALIIPETDPNPTNNKVDVSISPSSMAAPMQNVFPMQGGNMSSFPQPSPSSSSQQMNSSYRQQQLQMNNSMNQQQQQQQQPSSQMNNNQAQYQSRTQDANKSNFEEEMKKRGLEASYDPPTRQIEKVPKPMSLDNIQEFLARPALKGGDSVKCYIVRERGKFKLYPKYYLYLERGKRFLLAARKRKKNKSSNYLVSLDKDSLTRSSPSFFGKLRSNFIGTEFTMYSKGENPSKCGNPQLVRHQIGAILYETNLLGTKGPRKLTIVLPKVNPKDELKHNTEPEVKGGVSIIDDYRNGQWNNMSVFKNKLPEWSAKMNAYVLNFDGRVKQPSVKNFQLTETSAPSKVTLQFGKISENRFALDYSYPLSALQAFLIALSSFDTKFACE